MVQNIEEEGGSCDWDKGPWFRMCGFRTRGFRTRVPAVCFQWNLGEVIRSLSLTQNFWLFLSFLLSWEILVTSWAFICLRHHCCPLMQAGQPVFSPLGSRVSGTSIVGSVLRMGNVIPCPDLLPGLLLTLPPLPQFFSPSTSFSPPSLQSHPEAERKRRASFLPPHCEAKIYF